MIKVFHGQAANRSVNYHAETKKQYVPPVKLFTDESGQQMYIGVGHENKGKLYIKELFDRHFSVSHNSVKKVSKRIKASNAR